MRRTVALLVVSVLVLGLGSAALAGQDGKASRDQTVWGAGAGVGAKDAQGFAITPIGGATLRIHGANRYATAAAISEAAWTFENTITVFLATGENYPDALAIGPSSFSEGPLLLTQRNALPAETRAELERLEPCFIVAVGGPNAISNAVLMEADAYANPAFCFG